jgi:hypothetical protein
MIMGPLSKSCMFPSACMAWQRIKGLSLCSNTLRRFSLTPGSSGGKVARSTIAFSWAWSSSGEFAGAKALAASADGEFDAPQPAINTNVPTKTDIPANQTEITLVFFIDLFSQG